MTTPETPLNTEKNTSAHQIQEDEDYLNSKSLPNTRRKLRKGKFLPEVIREGKPVSKPKTKEKPVKKAKEKPVKKANDTPVKKPKVRPVRNLKRLTKKREKNKPNFFLETTSNKRKAQYEPVRCSLNFDEFESSSESNEITVNEHDHFDSSKNSCVLSWNADETNAGNFASFIKKKRTEIAKKEYKKDWSVIKWFTDEPQTNDCLSSECKVPVRKRKRTRITWREFSKGCLNYENDSFSNIVPHFKKRRKPNPDNRRNGWKNYKRLSSGGFTFETLKEYMPVSDKVGEEKHRKLDDYIVYSRRKFSTRNTPAVLYNVDITQPPAPQKVSICKVNEQSKLLELEDSKYVLENRTTETQSSTQPSVFEYEIPEPEASNMRIGNTSKVDVHHQPPTPEKLVGHNYNRNSMSKFGPQARVELIIAKQLELKGKPCAVKKGVPRLDFTLSNSSHMVDLHEGDRPFSPWK